MRGDPDSSRTRSDIGTTPRARRPAPVRRRRAVAALLAFGLLLGLQAGDASADHAHASPEDGIECVVCHGVRVTPPAERPVGIATAPDVEVARPAAAPIAASPAALALAGDPPRGPPPA